MTRDASEHAPADQTRRTLLAGAGACACVGLSMLATVCARAADAGKANLPMLQESDPAAQASRYVTDARRAKGATRGALCSNCALYDSVNASSGTCSLFPQKRVAGPGWCTAWASL
jgi:hypothetical protein